MIPDKYKNKTFVAKPDTWYDEGTEAFMISLIGEADDMNEFGAAMMKGWKSDHKIWTKEGPIICSGWDEEGCSLGEFDIIDEPSDYKVIELELNRGKYSLLNHKVVQKDNEVEVKDKIIYK